MTRRIGAAKVLWGGFRLLAGLAPPDRNNDGCNEAEDYRAKEDGGAQDMAEFDFFRFGTGRGFARLDGKDQEAILKSERGQLAHPWTDYFVLEVDLGRAVGREDSDKPLRNSLGRHLDFADLEDNLPSGELRGGDHGAVEVAKVVRIEGGSTHLEGDVDMHFLTGDPAYGKGLTQFVEFIKGGEGQVDFLRAEAENSLPLISGVGAEGFECSIEFDHCRGIGLQIRNGKLPGGLVSKLGDLPMLLEETPDPEANEEGEGGKGHDHDQAACARALGALGSCSRGAIFSGFRVFWRGVCGRHALGHGGDLAWREPLGIAYFEGSGSK